MSRNQPENSHPKHSIKSNPSLLNETFVNLLESILENRARYYHCRDEGSHGHFSAGLSWKPRFRKLAGGI